MSNHNPSNLNPGLYFPNSSSDSSTSALSHPIEWSPIPFKILQLNCHNSFDVTSNALNSDLNFSILVLQEPWINPHTLKFPHYADWSFYLDTNHSPVDYNDKHRTCFCFKRSFTSDMIHPIKDGSRILSAIDRDIDHDNIKKICLINLYNPPRSFEGI
jgi:hypothetical protein